MKFPGQELVKAWTRKMKRILGLGPAEESSLLSAAEDGSSDEETIDESPKGVFKSYGTMSSGTSGQPHEEGYFSSLFRRAA